MKLGKAQFCQFFNLDLENGQFLELRVLKLLDNLTKFSDQFRLSVTLLGFFCTQKEKEGEREKIFFQNMEKMV